MLQIKVKTVSRSPISPSAADKGKEILVEDESEEEEEEEESEEESEEEEEDSDDEDAPAAKKSKVAGGSSKPASSSREKKKKEKKKKKRKSGDGSDDDSVNSDVVEDLSGDEVDTSNIIAGGRRSRRGRPTSFAQAYTANNDDSDSDED